jgi:phospholipid N-methyltransferase
MFNVQLIPPGGKNVLMVSYRVSPYLSFIENRLFPGYIQYGVSHRLTGEILEPNQRVRALLLAAQAGTPISLDPDNLKLLGPDGAQLSQLIHQNFLTPDGNDPLAPFLNYYVARPMQNPALVYRANGDAWLVHTSMVQQVYSPRKGELPAVSEEKLPAIVAAIFELADGAKTLQEIFHFLRESKDAPILEDREFRDALDFLTSQERQLIKLTQRADDLADPYRPVNTVPRNLYHSSRWTGDPANTAADPIIAFHQSGIEEAAWEFDLIEPTVNHALRFPSETLGGLDYGARFCRATLRPEMVSALGKSDRLEVLEVGGGTGTFARSFLHEVERLQETVLKGVALNYHILDLSPALMESQQKILSSLLPAARHFQQDATQFNLPGRDFDLIVSNEVIADFPMASVQRASANSSENANPEALANGASRWQGEGVYYLEKYDLWTADAPENFLVSSGAFQFIERCWEHLRPGGTLVVSEYGATQRYPVQSVHLNHDEYSIHFGHLAACAAKVGFACRLVTLKQFLDLDDEVPVLNGREEHILCLNQVLQKFGIVLPYAIISRNEFEKQLQDVIAETGLTGFSFAALKQGFHFGPRIADFMVLIMNKPD